MPINPDFSALEAIITAKVEQVATNIDNKDLLIQMKALEAAVANLALTKVIAEGTYQQGQVTSTASAAVATLNAGVTAAEEGFAEIIEDAETNLNAVATQAITDFNAVANPLITQIEGLLEELGETNTQDIIDLVTASLGQITTAATAATTSINSTKDDALSIISSTGTSAISSITDERDDALDALTTQQSTSIQAIVEARDTAIAAVSASGNVTQALNLIRDDRWLGLNIFAPTDYTNN